MCNINEDTIDLLREWVRAESEYANALNTEGSDGYLQSAYGEREVANRLFADLKKKLLAREESDG